MTMINQFQIDEVQPGLISASTTATSSSVDMAGFDGVMFVGITFTQASNGGITIKAQGSNDNTSFSDMTDSAQVTPPENKANTFAILDLLKPKVRYIRTQLLRGVATGDSAWGGTFALRYRLGQGGSGLNPLQPASLRLVAKEFFYGLKMP